MESGSDTKGTPPWLRKTVLLLVATELALVAFDVGAVTLGWVGDEGLRELFNVARELSIGNWFSSAQQLGVAIALWLLFLGARKRGPRATALGWASLAGFFVYLALDDGTRLHERVGTALSDFYYGGGYTPGQSVLVDAFGRVLGAFPSWPWLVVFGPFLAVAGMLLVVFSWRQIEPRSQRLLVILALGLYALAQGQDFVEGLDEPYEGLTEALALAPDTFPHLMRVLEEFLEMLGSTILLYVFLGVKSRIVRTCNRF